jgi:glycosyltransferase involved in cell wall biosynthesis
VTGVQLLSLSERRELEEQGFSLAGKTAEVVRNGVEPVAEEEVAPGSRTADFAARHPRFAAVVGRIEPRKNQIEIARLASKHGIPLLFAGQENPRHAAYGAEFRQLIEDDDTLCHAGTLSRPEVAGLFQRAHVHVSASLFEVSPLVDLEARARGCRIVASRESHGTEFLDEYCELCDPWSSDSIERALLAAWQPQLRAPAMAVPTWDQSAEVLARMYQQILT